MIGKEKVVKECIRKKPAFRAIMAHAVLEFLRHAIDGNMKKQIKDIVNVKCRKMTALLMA